MLTRRDRFRDALGRQVDRAVGFLGRPWCWLRRAAGGSHHPEMFHPVCVTCGRIVPTGHDQPAPRHLRPPRRIHAPPPTTGGIPRWRTSS